MATAPDDKPPAAKRRPLRDVVLASGLVAVADLDAAEVEARRRVGAGSESGGTATEARRRLEAATAAVLVEQGRLTPFQAKEIQAGRTRFRLGQYTVTDEIGRGGMGQVFAAEHALMGRLVAVKVLPRSKATPESEAAFRREMRILGRLDHENLVRAFDAGYDAMVYYLVTELVPGIDLRRHVRKFGPLDETAAASVFAQVARGLSFAHAQRLVHRDIKPGNILVMDDGRVKVLDLGLAGSTLEAEALRLGRVVGTMDYIAPEQIRTPDDVGPPADIYSLGCSMYFALTGEVPFPGGTRKEKMRRHLGETPTPIQRLAPHLPATLCHVVDAMMAKSVADRIGSAEEVIQRLARWTPDRPLPLPRQPRGDPAMPPVVDAVEESSGGSRQWPPAWPVVDDAVPADAGLAMRDAPPPLPGATRRSVFEPLLGPWASSRWGAVILPAALAGAGVAVGLSLVRAVVAGPFAALPASGTCGLLTSLVVGAARALTGGSRLGRR